MASRKPNFFIIGAAKAGTTSLASWVAEHPQCFMSTPKEPDFFYPGGRVSSERSYRNIFAKAPWSARVVGEASVRYLSRQSSIRSIEEYTKRNAKYLVIIRNPIEMCISLHGQLFYGGIDPLPTLEEAWKDQSRRHFPEAAFPKEAYTPEISCYDKFCQIGSQLRAVRKMVDSDRLLVLRFEDIGGSARETWVRLQRFLEIDDDGRSSFPAKNVAERKVPRSWRAPLRVIRRLSDRFGVPSDTGVASALGAKLKLNKGSFGSISEELRVELFRYFEREIDILEKETGWNLDAWKL